MRHTETESLDSSKGSRKSFNSAPNDTERDPITSEEIIKKQDPSGPRDTKKKQEPEKPAPSKTK